jgi:hypothetical protein
MEDIMADTTKKTTDNATKGKKVEARLPRLPGQNAIQEEFFSVNGKNYIIKRGQDVEIPGSVAEVIRNGEKAEEYAMRYVDELKEKQNEKEDELKLK